MHLRAFWKNKSKDTDFLDDLKRNPDLMNLIHYDENFNNKRKVLFESCLAGIIRNNPRILYPSVFKVANSILLDFKDAFEKFKIAVKGKKKPDWLQEHFYKFFSENSDILTEYTGTYDKKIDNSIESTEKFIDWIYTTLSTSNDRYAYRQLLIIREYGNYFLRPYLYMPQFKDQNDGLGIFIVPEGVGNENLKPTMRNLWKKCNFDRSSDIAYSRISTKNTVRAKLTTQFGIFDPSAKISKKFKKFIPDAPVHLPGKHLWRVTSNSKFTQEGRYLLDMPLIASQGCSIALILIPAIVIGGLEGDELRYFNLNAISYMIGNGHHSLHEFNAAWKGAGIPYTDGNYLSIFPEKLIKGHPELFELQEKFPELLPLTKNKL